MPPSTPRREWLVWDERLSHVEEPPCPVAMRDERIWLFAAEGIVGRTFETSVWDHPIIPTWGFKHHKNEKPVSLMERLVAFLGPASILDPFMGSGTTGVACASGWAASSSASRSTPAISTSPAAGLRKRIASPGCLLEEPAAEAQAIRHVRHHPGGGERWGR